MVSPRLSPGFSHDDLQIGGSGRGIRARDLLREGVKTCPFTPEGSRWSESRMVQDHVLGSEGLGKGGNRIQYAPLPAQGAPDD